MLFIVFSIHLIDILKKLSHDEIEAFMYQDEPVELKLQNISTNLADRFNLNEQLPLQFLDNVKVGKNNIYLCFGRVCNNRVTCFGCYFI